MALYFSVQEETFHSSIFVFILKLARQHRFDDLGHMQNRKI